MGNMNRAKPEPTKGDRKTPFNHGFNDNPAPMLYNAHHKATKARRELETRLQAKKDELQEKENQVKSVITCI